MRGGEYEMQMIELPQKVIDGNFETEKVPPGTYSVAIKKMIMNTPNRVTALYEVLDEGAMKGKSIFDNFNVEFEQGQKLLREMLGAIGILPRSSQFDVDLCVGKTLSIVVRHKEDAGKVYVNVTDHLPF
jgi:hypothetical protein